MSGKGNDLDVSQLRDVITIKEPTSTLNTIGEPIRAWATLYLNQPAKWMPVAGSETIRGRTVEAGIKTIFVIRWQANITPEMRVVHSSGTYGIGYVKPIEGRRRYIELHCKAVA